MRLLGFVAMVAVLLEFDPWSFKAFLRPYRLKGDSDAILRRRGDTGRLLSHGSLIQESDLTPFPAFLRLCFVRGAVRLRGDGGSLIVTRLVGPRIPSNAIQGIFAAFIGTKAIRGTVRLRGDTGRPFVECSPHGAPLLAFPSALLRRIARIWSQLDWRHRKRTDSILQEFTAPL